MRDEATKRDTELKKKATNIVHYLEVHPPEQTPPRSKCTPAGTGSGCTSHPSIKKNKI